jgi:hypothetical protein
MGQEPHVLHGWVEFYAGYPRLPVNGARVEIIDGPNTGKAVLTNAQGMFVFDDLVTSPEFRMEASKSGYSTFTYRKISGLTRNDYVVGLYLK